MANSDVASVELEVEVARLQLERKKITAPFDAVILNVFAKPGTYVTTTHQLFRIAGKGDYQAELLVDVTDTGVIRPGQEVAISSDAYPDRSWRAEILRIAGTVDESKQGNTVAVRARLPKETPFRLGQRIDARLVMASKKEVPLLPFNAIRVEGANKRVAVVSNGFVRWRDIQTGIEGLTEIEITHGVAVGDTVVKNPQSDLHDGDQVVIAGDQ
jgi:RND family efflux transporter MFP subunit